MEKVKKARLYSYYGGKARLTREIGALIPRCSIYVEPFFGSGAIFFSLEKERYHKAVVNDMEEGVVHFIRLLASDNGEELIERLKYLIPNEVDFYIAKDREAEGYIGCTDMEKAVCFYITLTQSFNCLRRDFRRGMDVRQYQNRIATGLPEARKRLQGAEILQGDAYDVIERYKNDRDAVIFMDSPYLPSTRTAPQSYYEELDEADHVRLLLLVRDAKAKCILCGYQEEDDGIYDRYLLSQPHWNAQMIKEVTKPCANRDGVEGKVAQEWIWKNF